MWSKDIPQNSAKGLLGDALIRLSEKFYEHIHKMHADAFDAIESDVRHPLSLATEIAKLNAAAKRGCTKLLTQDPVPAPKRRRKKWAARDITVLAAGSFERLTGRRPTINVDPETKQSSGRFLNFLTEVFREFGIEASTEAQARAFVKEQKGG